MEKATQPQQIASTSSFQTVAEWSLIPSIIIATVISNQLTWSFGQVPARLIGWISFLSASTIVISNFRGKLWPMILITLVLASKIFQGLSGGMGLNWYMILYGLLMGITGSVMLTSRLDLVYKQLYYICLLNVFIMFLQVAGIADWTQFATTHAQDETNYYPVAFFNQVDAFDISQLRPAGLLYANQYLSVIALFGLALHFARKSEGFKTGTTVMCLMTVLAMSKLTFLGFILIAFLILISGNKYQKKSVLKGIALIVSFLYLYKLVFPGLFEANLNTDQIIFSASTRISAILYRQGAEEALSTLRFISDEYKDSDINIKVLMPSEVEDEEESQISGYEDLVKKLPYVIGAIIAAFPFYIWGFFKLRHQWPNLTTLTMTSLIIAMIIPAVGSLWGSPIYQFICGFAFLPLFFPLLKPIVNLKTI